MKENKKKVAFVANVYRHLEAFHLPFIELLQEKGFEIHAFAKLDNGRAGVLAANVICHDISFPRNPFCSDTILAYKQLLNDFKTENFQMVHVHTPIAGILARLAAKKSQVPIVVYTAHGFHFFKGAPLSNWVYYPIERLVSRWTDYLITINREDFSVAQSFPVKNKVLYVPGVGVNTQEFDFGNEDLLRRRKREELGLDENDVVILCVAEINRNKNQIQLIEALEKLRSKTPSVKCLIAGDGDKTEWLKARVQKLDLNNTVKILGFRRDINELLIASDIFVLPSLREGLPKALMEAMAAKKPVVASSVRGNRDLVCDGENGYLVPLGDINTTANRLLKLINNPADRQKMGLKS
ncbi:MAG TPA: glycosyltransferase family 4 protein, partial [Desulfobacteria bacterium]|nr:glycosyltransferase family 4 protein [Desulfobacteria bacterium]